MFRGMRAVREGKTRDGKQLPDLRGRTGEQLLVDEYFHFANAMDRDGGSKLGNAGG